MSAIDITKPVSGNPTTQSVRDNFAAAAAEIDALDTAVTILEATVSGFDSHLTATNNPHSVTKAQVGLGNVDNTSDASKPISTATQSALDAKQNALGFTPANSTDLTSHTSNTSNPHNVTKSQIGLSNVDNTSDLNKPISTATQAALDAKQNTLTNSDGLSEGTTNLYFTGARVLSTLLAGLSTATNAVITASDSVLSALGKLQKQISDNLTTLTSHTSNTSNPHSVTKTQIGLGNVDNTSDANKPISTATQIALNLKADSSTLTDHVANFNAHKETGPAFTYTSGRITRIDYDSGNYKLLSYDALNNYRISRVDYIRGALTTRKDFVYTGSVLTEITQTDF